MSRFKNSWQQIRRSPFQSLAAILTMLVTFFAISVFGFLLIGFSSIINYFETRPEVTAFLKDDVKQEEVEAIKKELSETQLIKQIRYVSKEEALKIYQEENKNNPLLLEMVTAEFLPASLEIAANTPQDLEKLAKILEGEKDSIEEVIFQKDLVSSLTKWTDLLRKIGVAVIGLLGIMATLITSVIISMKITARREQIEVERLLGADSFYIQAPFLLEGMFYGVFGCLIGFGLAFGLFIYLKPQLETFFAGVGFLPFSEYFWLALLGIELFAGILIGSFSSLVAVKKHLK